LKALRDSADAIAAFDVAVYMVSLDDAEKNRAFAEGLNAKHVVLSDPLKEAADSYGVLALAGLYARRWTFYIDEDGSLMGAKASFSERS
jgi:peroxiredoxin